MAVLPDDVERAAADIHEVVEPRRLAVTAVNDVRHVGGQHKWSTVSAENFNDNRNSSNTTNLNFSNSNKSLLGCKFRAF